MRRRREIQADEWQLWRQATRHVVPLREPAGPPQPPQVDLSEGAAAKALPKPLPAPVQPSQARERTAAAVSAPTRGAALDPDRPVGLDRRTWQRLKRGQIAIDRKLDLHGATQDEAHVRLNRFVDGARAAGHRCVLVVTGKGQAGGGILRHMVPRWLNDGHLRTHIVAYAPAQRHHGGGGALYVLLRRSRAGRLGSGDTDGRDD